MQLILSTPYINVYLHEEFNILYSEWSEAAKKMAKVEFKEHIVNFVAKVKEHGVRGFLTNSQKGHITMDLEIQEWHDSEIAPLYVEYGLEKIGFVLPEKDFFASISLQQTFDEAQAQQLRTKFFGNLDDALAWIKQ